MNERSAARGTAPDRLKRILYLLPAACSENGADVEELCAALEITREVLLADLTEVTARDFYLPPGRGDALRVSYDAERVRVRTTGQFRRPPRLTSREALALGLGLRVLAAERGGSDRDDLLELAGRLEAGLATVPEIEFAPDVAIAEASAAPDRRPDAASETSDGAPAGSAGEMRGCLVGAARERRACTFGYLKAGASEPENRRLEPYVLVASSGRWYAIGHDPDRDDVRAFRLDRMLGVAVTDERFERDPEFDLDRYLTGAYVYRPAAADPDGSGAGPHRARIRYSAEIARWILEREEGETLEDGAALVEHPVSDPGWASCHVLQYGGDAELLGPADLRARVTEGARKAEAAHT